MRTFLLILYAALVSALAALNVYASLRCWRDQLSSRAQRFGQIAFVWLVPGLGAALALHLVRAESARGGGGYAGEDDADLDDMTDFVNSDADGYTSSLHHSFHSGGGEVSSHH